MKLWAKTKEFFEGKYLVVRRDGTIPHWPHFVIGGDDPCGPSALRSYANAAEERGYDPDFVSSIYDMANEWEERHQTVGTGKADPDAAPHRQDDAIVIRMMRRELTLKEVISGYESACEG